MQLVSIGRKTANAIHAIVKVFSWICAALLFILAFISFIDCILRYFMGRSLTGAQELVEVGMGFFVYFGLAAVIMNRGGIQVPLITDHLGVRANSILRIVTDILSLVILIATAVEIYSTAGSTELSSAILGIPYAPVYYFAVVGCVFACLEFVIHIVEDFYGAITGKPNSDTKESEAND